MPLTCWSMVAAFGAYFCMYGLRKPFTSTSYEPAGLWHGLEIGHDPLQVIGYTLSKILGGKVISETRPDHRPPNPSDFHRLAGITGIRPATSAWRLVLFLNGLMLGMVFGLVLGFSRVDG